MIELKKADKFDHERKKFIKNNRTLAEKVIKVLTLFITHSKHPSLHLEKLQGSEVWTIRIDKGNRIFFVWLDENTVLLLDIGKHDKYREY